MTRQLNDNDRLRVRVLFHDARFTKKAICATTGFSMHQVKNAIRNPAVKPRSGRPPALSPEDEAALLAFVRAHPSDVPLTYAALADQCFGGKHGVYAIRSTLRRHGCTPRALRLRGKKTVEGDVAAAAAMEAARAARAAAAAAAAAKTAESTTAPTTALTETPEATTTAAMAMATIINNSSDTNAQAAAAPGATVVAPEPDEDEVDDELDDDDDDDDLDEEGPDTPEPDAVRPEAMPQS